MTITRREILGRLAASAVTSVAFQAFGDFGFAETPAGLSETSLAAPVRLCGNENAYGPPESVLAAMRESLPAANRYPGAEHELLLARLSALHRVKPEQIVLGCGSSEVLGLAASEYLGPGRKLVQAWPTCPLLGKFAQSVGAEVVNIPLTRSYEPDLDAMLAGSNGSAGMVYLCNPNNPTGMLTARKDIEAFIRKLPANTMVLMDEAYYEFVITRSICPSFLDYPCGDARVMVTRTFSKIYGLAGMRVGYLVASSDVARRLARRRLQFGVSGTSARGAVAALEDSTYVLMAARRNADDRQEFINRAGTLMLRAIHSHANFLMLKCPCPAEGVLEHMRNNNILLARRYRK